MWYKIFMNFHSEFWISYAKVFHVAVQSGSMLLLEADKLVLASRIKEKTIKVWMLLLWTRFWISFPLLGKIGISFPLTGEKNG